jgi:hypothetical protein
VVVSQKLLVVAVAEHRLRELTALLALAVLVALD